MQTKNCLHRFVVIFQFKESKQMVHGLYDFPRVQSGSIGEYFNVISEVYSDLLNYYNIERANMSLGHANLISC